MGGMLGGGLKTPLARRTTRDRQLGWTRIPARRVDRLSDEELRALEPDGNTERVDLNDFETSKERKAQMDQAGADAKREAEEQSRREARANSEASRAPNALIGRPGRRRGHGLRSLDPGGTLPSGPGWIPPSSAAPSAMLSWPSASRSYSAQAVVQPRDAHRERRVASSAARL